MRIYKYPIVIDDQYDIQLPIGAKVLCIQMQSGVPMMWALVDETRPTEKRRFYVRGTGHEMGPAAHGSYIGTFQIHNGALVFHVFDGGVK